MTRKIEMKLSVGQQEAFEIFLRDHEDRLLIENNRAVLQQRFVEAKTLGEQVNQIRIRVNELKSQLKIRRKQIAAQGLTENQTASESDYVEERILNQIEEEKKSYEIKSGCLKGLKTEIEHLQLLHGKLKVKLQKDFEKWWTQEGARLQGHSAENTESSPDSPLSCLLTRALPPAEYSSPSIPLTGHKETDADIQAFIRARHNLVNNTGAAK
ncbi:kinesin-like protein KIF6 [Puntigrus tetrazona]|uniref:kinesin-like protein KIF6 n=1 Tax=Puntigrus tetrazona TaxID=1606681 RepID=UPI001C89FBC0|nr:kinesin-like protein KIF6 [Puntigrus tetrazona]